MRPAALATAALLGLATLGGAAQAQTPAVSATVVIESGTVHVGGKRHDDFHRKARSHWRKGFANHHKSWRVGRPWHGHKGFARHHKRWQHGRHHRPVWAKRFHRAPVVIVKPAHGWFGHRHLPRRPVIRNGRFARDFHRWHRW